MPVQPKVFPFGQWMPDKADLEVNDGVVRAENCVPAASGYGPFKEFAVETDELDDRPLGAILSRDIDGAVYQFAGDETKLYQNVANAWTDVSKVGGYTTDVNTNVWEFARWQNTVIATNYDDDPQTIDLGGANFADLTTDLQFKHVGVVRDFVVAGYTNDGVDGPVPWRVRWCAFKDPTDWTVDPATLCDFEDLSQREIKKVFGGEYGVILQDEAIVRMTFVGAPLVFQFDEVVPDLGLLASGLATRSADTIYFASTKGFFSLTNGANVAPIGHERIDATFLADIDRTNLHRCSSVADPQSHRVYFGYPGQGNTEGLPNKILCYDPARDRFSEILVNFELLWETAGTGTTLEELDALYGDLDAMDISLDSTRFIGGANALAAFDSLFRSGFFDGANMEATIETREYMFDNGQRTRVHGFRPFVEGDSVSITGQIGTRNDPTDDVTYSALLTPNSGGRICCRANGRYHRFVLRITGQWTQAYGVLVEQRDLGYGGRRG